MAVILEPKAKTPLPSLWPWQRYLHPPGSTFEHSTWRSLGYDKIGSVPHSDVIGIEGGSIFLNVPYANYVCHEEWDEKEEGTSPG